VKVLYTVQRYGEDLVGGSEAACRLFAEQLARRGHHVEVATSCARSYVDWADEYEPGTVEINGVRVHRFRVAELRSPQRCRPLDDWIVRGPRPMPLFQQQRWLRLLGPQLDGYAAWLRTHAADFDAIIHMTYRFATTTMGLPITSGRAPTLLQPTAHDESGLWVRQFDTLFRLADAFVFFTPEERRVVADRFDFEPDGEVIGMGMDLRTAADDAEFRRRCSIGDRPYLLYVGRIDTAKGVGEAQRFFAAYKDRNPGPLALVFAGEAVVDLPVHPDVFRVGFLDETTKASALAGCLALLQPSYFESFSIVLCEAWSHGRPALVQGACDVLAGQARRSGGALPYQGFAEFEAALDALVDDAEFADRLGANGRRFVADMYNWPTVIEGVERAIQLARRNFARRPRPFASRVD
jgi:glycosyltransferase involved in cell wall biosynthesis